MFEFRSLENFIVGNARRYEGLLAEGPTGEPGDIIERNLSQTIMGAYLQDNWQVKSDLTLNLGLRFEHATQVKERDGLTAQLRNITDDNSTVGPLYENPKGVALSPRVGFVWAPGEGKSSLRGGFGIFYEHVNLHLIRTALGELPPFTLVGRIDDRQIAPVLIDYPRAGFTQIELAQGRPNMRGFQYNVDRTYSLRFSLTYQRQLAEHMVATLDYTGFRRADLVYVVAHPVSLVSWWWHPTPRQDTGCSFGSVG